MIFADILLDTSWSLSHTSGPRRNFRKLDELMRLDYEKATPHDNLEYLAGKLQDHLIHRGTIEPKDELNDQATKHGQLSKCSISAIKFEQNIDTGLDKEISGLLIEACYQLATYRIVILRNQNPHTGASSSALMLHKGNQRFLNHFKDWLDTALDLPPAESFQLTPYTLLQIFSGFVDVVSTGWTVGANPADALRVAILRQIVGNVKITITFAAAENPDLATKLKHIDLDIPSDTINELIGNTAVSQTIGKGAGNAALEGLSKGTHEKTGLKLPFTPDQASSDQIKESLCKVTKIACATFAISTEGKLKFSGKPIEQAELVGYEETLVRNTISKILELLLQGAESRVQNSGED